jgi:hypothetical protein
MGPRWTERHDSAVAATAAGAVFRLLRDEIRERVRRWIDEIQAGPGGKKRHANEGR